MRLRLALGLPLLAALALAAGERTEHKTFKLAAGSSLRVATANSPIVVNGWDRDEVVLDAEIRDTEARPVKVETRETAGRLEIEAVFPESPGGWTFGRGASCAFRLSVPRRLQAEFRTSNAPLTAADLEGRLTFRTSNAPLNLSGLGGDVEARTSNAPFTARQVSADLRGSTSNAPLRLEAVTGAVDLQTSNGSVTATGLDGRGKGIRLATSNGGMTVDLGKAGGELVARTSRHESISFHRSGAEQVEIDKGTVRAKLPGSSQRIELRTSNGGIEIR
ncbi:MAG: hypothetical protein U0P81_11065 [Holophagaceae bacterium]